MVGPLSGIAGHRMPSALSTTIDVPEGNYINLQKHMSACMLLHMQLQPLVCTECSTLLAAMTMFMHATAVDQPSMEDRLDT